MQNYRSKDYLHSVYFLKTSLVAYIGNRAQCLLCDYFQCLLAMTFRVVSNLQGKFTWH